MNIIHPTNWRIY